MCTAIYSWLHMIRSGTSIRASVCSGFCSFIVGKRHPPYFEALPYCNTHRQQGMLTRKARFVVYRTFESATTTWTFSRVFCARKITANLAMKMRYRVPKPFDKPRSLWREQRPIIIILSVEMNITALNNVVGSKFSLFLPVFPSQITNLALKTTGMSSVKLQNSTRLLYSSVWSTYCF